MGQPYLVQLIGSYFWDDIEDLARGMTARDARRAVADGTSSSASMRRLVRPLRRQTQLDAAQHPHPDLKREAPHW